MTKIARLSRPPTPVTDAEVQTAVDFLRRYPTGFTREDLARVFGSDRRGRDVLAYLGEAGIAPVVVVTDAYHADRVVYRFARTEDEVQREERRLLAYETSARRRREGVRAAWDRSGTDVHPAQSPLFAREPWEA